MAREWQKCDVQRLMEEHKLLIGDGYRAKNSELAHSGLPFARAGNINQGFQFSDADHFPEMNLARVGNKVSESGDVVFTSKGTVGRFAFVRPTTPRFIYSPQLCFWRSLDWNAIHPQFLYYWMFGREFYVQFKGVAGQTDMAEYVSLGDQRHMRLTLPPHEEQVAIANILGTLDDRIELNRKMNETLEEMARALFKSWFVDFDPVRAKMDGRWKKGQSLPSLPVDLYDYFPSRLVDSELGEIPEGWDIGMLGSVAEHQRRGVQPDEIKLGTPYIALEHMPRHCIALSDWGKSDGLESNKFRFKTGEILFGKLRPYFHKVGVAPVDGVCSTDIVVIAPKSAHWFGFVLGHVSSTDFVEYTNAGSTGTKMPRTNWGDMARYRVAIPPERLVEVSNSHIGEVVNRIILSNRESRTLTSMRDSLLPKLVSGELRIVDTDKYLGRAV
jgi:type I restriction enzyme S subunit